VIQLTKFKYAFDNKRYHTWNYHLRNTFGEKVFKVSINAGFTCPNIDGKISHGGCTYCSKEGSGDGKRDELVGPLWSLKKWEVLNAIDDELKRRDSYQGLKFNK